MAETRAAVSQRCSSPLSFLLSVCFRALLAVCGAPAAAVFRAISPPRIQLNPQTNTVDVTGLPAATLAALSKSRMDRRRLAGVASRLGQAGRRRGPAAGCSAGGGGEVCRRRRGPPLHADVSVRRGPSVPTWRSMRPVCRLVPGHDPWRHERHQRGRRKAGRRAVAVDGRHACLSEWRRRSRQSAPDVSALLRADGLAERVRLRHAPRRARTGSRRCVPSARRGFLERRSHALHRVLRSGPRQARHPAEPADGARPRGGEAVHAPRQARVAGRAWPSAQGRVPARVPREPGD